MTDQSLADQIMKVLGSSEARTIKLQKVHKLALQYASPPPPPPRAEPEIELEPPPPLPDDPRALARRKQMVSSYTYPVNPHGARAGAEKGS